MVLARSNNVDAARVLIEHGADVNARKRGASKRALIWAAAQKQPAMVKLLLEHGADPERALEAERIGIGRSRARSAGSIGRSAGSPR